MKSGAERGVAAARWPWARGGDYGQESCLPAAALLLAGSGAGLGILGSAHPSLSHGDPRISGLSWKLLLLWRRRQPGAAACGEEGDWESPQPQLPALPLPRAAFRGRRHSRNL